MVRGNDTDELTDPTQNPSVEGALLCVAAPKKMGGPDGLSNGTAVGLAAVDTEATTVGFIDGSEDGVAVGT